ncbi:DNA translocase FtsK [Listeria grandensis]|uniref:DNA translocase FtsK n=1 Tax=Listeria grandensis TaxID=1494963 RepID=UPI00164EB26B|nr:DNA translocase FtsK [Listeria grandensis]MBC6314572.1 DNA translocase FtsK [Listeria grandensis]
MANQTKKKSSRSKKTTRKKKQTTKSYSFEISGVIIAGLSLIGIFNLGFIGRLAYALGEFIAGDLAIALLIGFAILGIYFIFKGEFPPLFTKRLNGCYLIFLGFLTFFQMWYVTHVLADGAPIFSTMWKLLIENLGHPSQIDQVGGGIIGSGIVTVTYFLIDRIGTNIIATVLVIYGLSLLTGIPLRTAYTKVVAVLHPLFDKMDRLFEKGKKRKVKPKKTVKPKPNVKEAEPILEVAEEPVEPKLPPIISNFQKAQEIAKKEVKLELTQDDEAPPITFQQESFENEIYQLPPIDLLTPAEPTDQSKEYDQIKANAQKLESTFESFGVKAKITQVHLGPAVTKYEVQPSVGVKVSKIVGLSDDIALALAAKDIRIEAPIPGKSAIGIEVANQTVAMVALREVLENNPNDRPDEKLQIALGRDISGDAIVANLDKMPHMLVAGATGSGKSVCINGIITSILLRAKPHEVKMMMIDPKMVELNVYNGIPHLLAPVVTNPKKAAQALQKVVSEMERRYDLFSHTGTRNMAGYNAHVRQQNEQNEAKQAELPFIVVIVDELADLMMVASNDVEDAITRLAQMARAAGIHLIIATQRPSVDVITGVIKANIPSRIAFAVSSSIDSRTILDMGGAEKLLGRGDMLFLPVGSSKPVRIQGAFLSDQEVEDIVSFVVAQQKAQYNEDMIPDEVPDVDIDAEDELYNEAVELVRDMQTASVSMLQRKFRIGYNRAARIIDEMEQRGVVGPHEGSKPRRVNISDIPEYEE